MVYFGFWALFEGVERNGTQLYVIGQFQRTSFIKMVLAAKDVVIFTSMKEDPRHNNFVSFVVLNNHGLVEVMSVV